MKKRFLTFILTIATMLMCIFGFSACGGNVEFKINFVVENEVYATVSTSGNEVISMPENPTKDDYTFDGWYWDENTWEKPFTANSLLDAPLSSDMKVYAKFNKNHTHEYTPTTTEPTCTEKGIITYTCTCGDSYTEDIPATGVHTWDDGKVTTEPTCTEKGVKTFTCTVCETTTYTEDVEALKHDEKTHEAQAPTCTEIGWEEYVTCERDGCEYSTYEEIPATGVHTWDKGEETKAPTCTKEGEMTYTCTVCKTTTKTEPIDKLPHEHNTEKWTSNATYHWHECVCGDKKGEEKHTAGAPATATTPQTCTVCGYVLQVETGILFNTLTVDGTKVYGKVSNTTTEFSFIDEVTVKGNATYVVDNDKDCGSPIYSKTVDLKIGDNTFYVLEMIGNDVKLFTVTIRRRPMYEVTFNANGGTSVQKQVIEEDDLATEPETTRTGYTFTGWDYDFTQAITENTKITASWSANKDTKYTVNYYLQNLDDSNYTLHESVELTGETDTTATADVKEYTHFTFNQGYYKNALSGNINPNGSRVLSVYYTRDTYSIVANNNNAKAGTSTQINGTYKYDKEFTLTATTNAGYTWLGWYDGETLACEEEEFTFKVEKNVTYTATWSANPDTKYTVNYYLQNLDDSNYTLHESVELKGTTDTTATAEIKDYTHFTYNANKSVISGNINGDGSQVLSVYYTRDKYVISTARNNTKAGTVTAGGTYKFDKQITLTATTNAGYTWLGWYDGENLVCETKEFTFKAEKNVTYTATWSANTDTKYTVNYYLQNIDDDEYTLHESVELEGETDTPTAEVYIKEYTHFTYNASKSVISGNINGDGGQVLGVYYTRDKYVISTARNNTKAGTVTAGGTYKFDKQITLTATTNAGYTWLGWYDGENLVCETKEFTFKAEKGVTYTATWSANTDTKYTVNYYLQNLDDDGYALHETVELTGETDTPTAEVYIKEYTHFTYNASKSVISGNINGDGGQVLSVYYTRNKYMVTVTGGALTLWGAYKYGTEITSTATPYLGYEFSGWYSGEELLSTDATYTFTVDKDVMAKFAVKVEMSYFNFSTTATTCSITGVKDKTVTSIIIPDYVTSIGSRAFYYCSNLSSITIGKNISAIGQEAFYGLRKLVEVVNKSTHITVTKGSSSNGYVGYYALAVYNSDSGITESQLTTDNGYIICTDGEEKILVNYTGTETDLTLPTYITQINKSAFYENDTISKVVIPDNVGIIGDYAFYSCSSLHSIYIGDSVGIIGNLAFKACTALKGVYITDIAVWLRMSIRGETPYSSPLWWAKRLYLNNELVTDVVVPDGVGGISTLVFYEYGLLRSIVIPTSMRVVATDAFYSCGLQTIYYKGTESQWRVEVGEYNKSFENATKYYYSETQPTTSGNYWHYVDGVPTKW